MKIAVVGAGAIGSYFGGRLAQSGEEVTFIARGETLAALASRGLYVESFAGDWAVEPVAATDDPGAVGEVDAVLFGVKAWQVEEAARSALPLFGADTCALPLQNGVEAPAALTRALGEGRALGGLCRVVVKVAEPGRIQHIGAEPSIDFGELDDRPSERTECLRAAFERSGVRARIPESIQAAMWEKFLFIVPTSAVGAVTGAPLGEVRELPETRELVEEAMLEIWRLARARGIPVADGVVERTLAFLDKLPHETTASMQRDILAGRPSEFDAQCGAVLRLAAESGVKTPVNRFLHAALLPAVRRSAARAAT